MNTAISGKKKYQSRRQIARRAHILATTRDMLAEIGYERTTIRGLAERARVAPGTLYNLYRSKDELIVAAVQELLSQLGQAAGQASQPGIMRILAMIEQTARVIEENPEYAKAMTKVMFGPGEHERLDAILYRRYLPYLETELHNAVKRNELVESTPVSTVAKHLQAQYWGIVVGWIMGIVETHEIVEETRRSQALALANYAQGIWKEKLKLLCEGRQ
ncbi:MAG: TetR/AcrR family transcriptional regulator [Pseudomonadota bacterium]|nr:TetR/AcrR family transcriptional regulator [Pseudomonadota bacterium]